MPCPVVVTVLICHAVSSFYSSLAIEWCTLTTAGCLHTTTACVYNIQCMRNTECQCLYITKLWHILSTSIRTLVLPGQFRPHTKRSASHSFEVTSRPKTLAVESGQELWFHFISCTMSYYCIWGVPRSRRSIEITPSGFRRLHMVRPLIFGSLIISECWDCWNSDPIAIQTEAICRTRKLLLCCSKVHPFMGWMQYYSAVVILSRRKGWIWNITM